MKKFHFSLEKLKDFREQKLQEQKNFLGKLRHELNEINAEINTLRLKVNEKNNELLLLYKKGAVSFEISTHKRYIISLQQEIKARQHAAVLKEKDIEKQTLVVLEATKDLKTLENLEEKQIEEYKKQETKENELFIEEFVANSSFRGEN